MFLAGSDAFLTSSRSRPDMDAHTHCDHCVCESEAHKRGPVGGDQALRLAAEQEIGFAAADAAAVKWGNRRALHGRRKGVHVPHLQSREF